VEIAGREPQPGLREVTDERPRPRAEAEPLQPVPGLLAHEDVDRGLVPARQLLQEVAADEAGPAGHHERHRLAKGTACRSGWRGRGEPYAGTWTRRRRRPLLAASCPSARRSRSSLAGSICRPARSRIGRRYWPV